MRIIICIALFAAATASPARLRRGVIHQEPESKGNSDSIGSSGYHHEVEHEHEHAKSHQSIKLEHFHPVPVYVKKEHAHLLKHPVEKGKSAHTLKQIHPKTEHHHGYGLVLENHRYEHDAEHGSFGGASEGHGFGGSSGSHGFSDHSDNISEIEHIPEAHELSEHEGGGESEGHGWGESTQQLSGYEGHQDGHFQFSPEELSHLGGHESDGGEY